MTATNTAPRFAIRCTFPRYDERDAFVGTTTYTAEMAYGTVAGAIAAVRMYEAAHDGETAGQIVDLQTGAPVARALVLRALGENEFAGPGAEANDKDGIPF